MKIITLLLFSWFVDPLIHDLDSPNFAVRGPAIHKILTIDPIYVIPIYFRSQAISDTNSRLIIQDRFEQIMPSEDRLIALKILHGYGFLEAEWPWHIYYMRSQSVYDDLLILISLFYEQNRIDKINVRFWIPEPNPTEYGISIMVEEINTIRAYKMGILYGFNRNWPNNEELESILPIPEELRK